MRLIPIQNAHMSTLICHSHSIEFTGRPYNSLRAEIVTTLEQLIAVFAIRALWLDDFEERLPYKQAYDGNDLQATHIVVYEGDEPVGSVRIRWFNGFAKAERLVFRRSHRNGGGADFLAEFLFRHVARKGYSRLVIHATRILARRWRALGFRINREKAPVEYENGQAYYELIKDLSVPSNAITEQSEVAILYRVEGQWDTPSQFEK